MMYRVSTAYPESRTFPLVPGPLSARLAVPTKVWYQAPIVSLFVNWKLQRGKLELALPLPVSYTPIAVEIRKIDGTV